MPGLTRTIGVATVAVLACFAAGCSSSRSSTECSDGSAGTVLATIGGNGTPAQSPIIDATSASVELLVQYTERQSGLLPMLGTQVAVVLAGESPVLVDGDLGSANRRLESARRTPRSIRLAKGRFFLATGQSDGPVEIRRCP